MTTIERAILEALDELETAAVSRLKPGTPSTSTSPGTRVPILPILERVDRLAAELPPDASPDLRHYLQRKSYQKARLFLLGRDTENSRGGCVGGR